MALDYLFFCQFKNFCFSQIILAISGISRPILATPWNQWKQSGIILGSGGFIFISLLLKNPRAGVKDKIRHLVTN